MISIEVYSREHCQQCRATMRSFDRADVTVSELEITPWVEDFKAIGATSAPVVMVYEDGQMIAWWCGYQPADIKAASWLWHESREAAA